MPQRSYSSARALVLNGRAARPSDARARRNGDLTEQQKQRPDIERVVCTMCSKHVRIRDDGKIAGHQSSRGISCPGAVPTSGSARPNNKEITT